MEGGTEEQRMNGEEKKANASVKMGLGSSSIDKSTASDVVILIEGSNQINQNGSTSPSPSTKNTNAADASNGKKGKICKGCLYYSSLFKANSRDPLCVGAASSIPNVPQHIVQQAEMKASKEGRSLSDFRYGCVGYSLYMDQKQQASNSKGNQTTLPVCVGLEVLLSRRINSTDSVSTPTHVHTREDDNGLPQRRPQKPAHSTGNDFLSRFGRNAGVVAKGVAKNARKVGNHIKQSLLNMLLPDGRRPK